MDLNTINSENSLLKKSLHNIHTDRLLNTLKEGEHASLEGDDGSFVFYKKGMNEFGVNFNSAGISFTNNPMTRDEMQEVLSPVISHSDSFEGKIPNDLLVRLRDMFFQVNRENEGKDFTIEDLLKNISLDNILSALEFKKELLKETESNIANGLIGYINNAVNILNELISQYPENSIIKNKIQEKLDYLESYKKTFSDGKFIEGIKNNISDLDNFLDILENQDTEGELASQIKNLRNKRSQNDFYEKINDFFNKIYAWDAFAIPYAQFGDRYGIAWSVDQGTKAFAELNGWDKGSEEINRLGKKQEPLMDEKLSFEQKKEAFQNANQEYLNSIGFILGTGCNALPSNKEYYENIKNQIKIEEFISMPCSDIYPAVVQKTILPFYMKDLYQEVCELLGKKSLDKSINQYINDLKNPSGLAKLSAAFTNNEKKIKSLENIVEKIQSLGSKLSNLDKQISYFQNKRQDELIIMASEFGIGEDFVKVNNTNVYPPFTMPDQDKWLNFRST